MLVDQHLYLGLWQSSHPGHALNLNHSAFWADVRVKDAARGQHHITDYSYRFYFWQL